jgi:hypothetical protein
MPFIEITVTVPKEIVSIEKVRQAIIDAQNRKTKQALTDLFKQTVQGWKTPPQFAAKRIDTTSQLGIRVYPTGQNTEQYGIVNAGSPSHIIRPRKAKMLRFQTGYRAGTKPRVLSSKAYERSGGFISTGLVHHPGFEAREFTQTIAKEHEPDFKKDMQEAIKNGSK